MVLVLVIWSMLLTSCVLESFVLFSISACTDFSYFSVLLHACLEIHGRKCC